MTVYSDWTRPDGKGLLSQSQMIRYKNNGVTKDQYESGVSVTAARGHGSTPEHGAKDWRKAIRDPGRYKSWLENTGRDKTRISAEERDALADRVFRNAQRNFGSVFKYSEKRLKDKIENTDPREGIPVLTVKQLRILAQLDAGQWASMASWVNTNDKTNAGLSWLYYH